MPAAAPHLARIRPGSILSDWRATSGPEALRTRAAAPLAAPRRPMRRSFAGAHIGNLTASFQVDGADINETLAGALRILRGRSRNLAKNNDYVRKFLRMVQNHVAGPNGFVLSVPCTRPDGSIDETDKLVVEGAFKRWGRRGTCDVTERLSVAQLQRLLVLTVARDGEAFVRRVTGTRHNPFGYVLQVIDPARIDDTLRADLANGNRIRMGIELDAWGREVAYHMVPAGEYAFGQQRTRVPASEMWHIFLQEETDQVRGVPWVHSALRRLNDLGGYEEAAVIAARIGASNMGFFIPPKDGPLAGVGQLAEQVQDGSAGEAPEMVREAAPGTFEELPEGYDFKSFSPEYPHQNFDMFVKAMLRGVASGVGADYNTLANDLENVNYSSIRSGKLETQDGWIALQSWFAESFLDPLYTEWLGFAFASGQLGFLPVSKFAKYDVAVWQGRRWPWVDPKSDLEATKLELDLGLISPSQVIRQLGRDPESVWREIEKDRKRIASLPPIPGAPAAAPAATPTTPSNAAT